MPKHANRSGMGKASKGKIKTTSPTYIYCKECDNYFITFLVDIPNRVYSELCRYCTEKAT